MVNRASEDRDRALLLERNHSRSRVHRHQPLGILRQAGEATSLDKDDSIFHPDARNGLDLATPVHQSIVQRMRLHHQLVGDRRVGCERRNDDAQHLFHAAEIGMHADLKIAVQL